MSKKTKKVEQPNNAQNTQKEEIDKEKNIIERTQEVREISKQMKFLCRKYVIDRFVAMERILDFLALQPELKFIRDYLYNERILACGKIIIPQYNDADENELKYYDWCCTKLEQAQQVMKKYRNTEEKTYRLLCDYIIIDSEICRNNCMQKVRKNLYELRKIAYSKILDDIFFIEREISSIMAELREKGTVTSETEFMIAKEARKYIKKVIKNTSKRFPEILEKDSLEMWTKDNYVELITEYEEYFEDIENDLIF